jgi:predicted transcriptional regulator
LARTGIEAEESGRVLSVAGANQTAILKVLTPENRRLMGLIFHHKPDSIGSLSKLAGKAQPNVSRALASLEEAGMVKIVGTRPKRPELAVNYVAINLTDMSPEDEC